MAALSFFASGTRVKVGHHPRPDPLRPPRDLLPPTVAKNMRNTILFRSCQENPSSQLGLPDAFFASWPRRGWGSLHHSQTRRKLGPCMARSIPRLGVGRRSEEDFHTLPPPPLLLHVSKVQGENLGRISTKLPPIRLHVRIPSYYIPSGWLAVEDRKRNLRLFPTQGSLFFPFYVVFLLPF